MVQLTIWQGARHWTARHLRPRPLVVVLLAAVAANGPSALADPEKRATLYPTRKDYVAKVNRRVNELVRSGWLLRKEAEAARAEAAETSLRWSR